MGVAAGQSGAVGARAQAGMSLPPGRPKEDEGLQTSPLGGTPRSVQRASTGIPIQISGCGKTFEDGTRALEPIDLEIGAGETIVLLGPSG